MCHRPRNKKRCWRVRVARGRNRRVAQHRGSARWQRGENKIIISKRENVSDTKQMKYCQWWQMGHRNEICLLHQRSFFFTLPLFSLALRNIRFHNISSNVYDRNDADAFYFICWTSTSYVMDQCRMLCAHVLFLISSLCHSLCRMNLWLCRVSPLPPFRCRIIIIFERFFIFHFVQMHDNSVTEERERKRGGEKIAKNEKKLKLYSSSVNREVVGCLRITKQRIINNFFMKDIHNAKQISFRIMWRVYTFCHLPQDRRVRRA